MTMTVELGALEQVVSDLVREGRYGSKSEVLRTGVRLVQERELALSTLIAKLDSGIAEADAGKLIPVEEVRARLTRQFGLPGSE